MITNNQDRGLSNSLQKELFLDIDRAGGINYVDVDTLCKTKPAAYALQRHKLKSRLEYLGNLDPLRYQQARERVFLGLVKTHTFGKPKAVQEQTIGITQPRPSSDMAFTKTSTDMAFIKSFNVQDPYDNEGVEVYPFFDKETPDAASGKKYLVNGYMIRVVVDMGYLEDERMYRAKLSEDSTVIILTVPKTSSYAVNPLVSTIKANQLYTRSANAQMSTAINKIKSLPEEQVKTVSLKAPINEVLSNELFSPNSTDGTIDCKFHPFQVDIKVLGKVYSTWCCEVEWLVSTKGSKRLVDPGKSLGESKRISALKGAFGGL